MKRPIIILLMSLLIIAAGYSIYRVLTVDDTETKVAGQQHFLLGKNILDMKVMKDRHDVQLKRYLTKDINIINFWASWCEPCNKEMPELVAYDDSRPNHVGLIGMNIKDKAEAGREFIKRYHADYTMLTAADSVMTKDKIYNIPTTLFVDQKGKVMKVYVGELNQEKIKQLVEQVEEEH